jgi:adenylate cyclase
MIPRSRGPLPSTSSQPDALAELALWRRWYTGAAGVAFLLGAAVHAGFVAVFLRWGVVELAWFNGLSVVLMLTARLLVRRGYAMTSYAIGVLEIYVHAAVCLERVGWSFGAQYYLFCSATMAMVLPASRRMRIALFAVQLALAMGLMAWYHDAPSPVTIDATELTLLHTFNVAGSFGLIGCICYFLALSATRAELALSAEHDKSEELLGNVLPAVIVRRLKEDKAAIAEAFPSASVLFADIVGFTGLAETSPPQALVDLLNQIFSRFDDLVTASGLEKIKTIGDAYMVAAGIPVARPDHVDALLDLAIAMRATFHEYCREIDQPLQLRIGVSSGPVVAGVIGRQRFLYDLWGDTVNVAARMESHGVADEIQVSAATHTLSRRHTFEARGVVEIKGKGPMPTYLLRGGGATQSLQRPVST